VRATAWAHLTATTCAPGGGVASFVVVSRFFCFLIQMNFAENREWPSSRRWRGRPTDGAGESMRRGQSKRRAAPAKLLQRTRRQPLQGSPPASEAAMANSAAHLVPEPNPPQVPYPSDTHSCPLEQACRPMAPLAIGTQWVAPSTKPVAQASRRTGVAR
jgi:hypothetical protein